MGKFAKSWLQKKHGHLTRHATLRTPIYAKEGYTGLSGRMVSSKACINGEISHRPPVDYGTFKPSSCLAGWTGRSKSLSWVFKINPLFWCGQLDSMKPTGGPWISMDNQICINIWRFTYPHAMPGPHKHAVY